MVNFNLKQLEAFTTAAELCSFTKAAHTLFLTQSTVSAHIQALERTLGVSLFIRDTRKKIQLSQAGHTLYPYAKDILERCQTIQSLLQPESNPCSLTIAASTVPTQCIVPALMAGFQTHHPNCHYVLQKGDSAQVHKLLKQRTATIGFVGAKVDAEEFLYRPLVRDKLVLLTANNAYFRNLQAQGALGSDLLAEPMVSRERGSGTRQRFEAYLAHIGFALHRLNIVAQIDQPEPILSAVESGLGVTVYSELAAKARLQDGKLLQFELTADSLYREIYLVVSRLTDLTPLEQSFVSFIKNRFHLE